MELLWLEMSVSEVRKRSVMLKVFFERIWEMSFPSFHVFVFSLPDCPWNIWHCDGTSVWEDIRDTDINHFMNIHFRSVWWRGNLVWWVCDWFHSNFRTMVEISLTSFDHFWNLFFFSEEISGSRNHSKPAWPSRSSVLDAVGHQYVGEHRVVDFAVRLHEKIWRMNSKPSVKNSKKHRRRSEPVS